MWNGAADALKPSPQISIARPKRRSASLSRPAAAIPAKSRWPVAVDRAEDVERQREPLEPEEERHQVVRGDEEGHPGAGRREQRVVLADVVVARALAVGDPRCDH